MYRVFEALDELVQTVDQAYGVPMTANCMVPRNEVLALLDDLRNALPVEIDDAQDVLDKADSIVDEAEDHARQLILLPSIGVKACGTECYWDCGEVWFWPLG